MAGHLVTVLHAHGTAMRREGTPAQALSHFQLSIFDKSLQQPQICARIVRTEGHGAFPEKWPLSISIDNLGFSQLPPAQMWLQFPYNTGLFLLVCVLGDEHKAAVHTFKHLFF